MVGLRRCVNNGTLDDPHKSKGMFTILSDPATLPHIALLVILSGSLYAAMSMDVFGSENQGAAIFVSLSLSYMVAALIRPSRLGRFLLIVERNVEGVANKEYLIKGIIKTLPIIALATMIWYGLNTILNNENLNDLKWFLAMMFIAMSVFQGLTLTVGWIEYGKKIQRTPRDSRSGVYSSLFRIGISFLLLIPLVWWFGYGAVNPSTANFSTNLAWFIFLIAIFFLGLLMERYTKSSRGGAEADGIARDRVYFLIFITSCWHLLSSWRRSPFTVDQSSVGLFIEECFLMSITILLAVWSMSKKGHKRGWRIFQGQSAVFWGVCFGLAYCGSVSSLTVLSEGSLMTTTSIGHAITAIVMLAICPIALSWIGASEELESQLEISDPALTQNEVPPTQIARVEESSDEDIVEIIR
tara:strand:+ start:16296 stop:17531 length:1236 start_codon:yes stop_codon:yes gene_type:complete